MSNPNPRKHAFGEGVDASRSKPDPAYTYIVTQANHAGTHATVLLHSDFEHAKGLADHIWNGGCEGPVPVAMYPIGHVFPIIKIELYKANA